MRGYTSWLWPLLPLVFVVVLQAPSVTAAAPVPSPASSPAMVAGLAPSATLSAASRQSPAEAASVLSSASPTRSPSPDPPPGAVLSQPATTSTKVAARARPTPHPTSRPFPRPTPRPSPRSTPRPAPRIASLPAGYATSSASSGMRFRFPAIGIDQRVYDYGCRGGTLPNLVEEWTCSGTNNAYLLGHAWGVFKPLHDAYGAGRLRVGQVAYFTSDGLTRTYRVAWIRIVPDSYVWNGLSGADWAWNATAGPSVTLQTCWGSTSHERIIVRLTT